MKMWKIFVGISLISIGYITTNCLPDRMPPEPIEQDRPEFVQLLEPSSIYLEDPTDSSAVFELKLTTTQGFPVDPNAQIVFGFNEPMDANSFYGNVLIYSSEGDTVEGTFFGGTDSVTVGDSLTLYTVRFEPSGGWEEATEYFVTLLGGVKDLAGNSASISPDYSENFEFVVGKSTPLPRIFLGDRIVGKVIAIDTFNVWEFTNRIAQPTEMVVSPDGSELYITDEGTSSPFLRIFDPISGTVLDSIEVGARQNGLDVCGNVLAVATKSPRAYWLIDMANHSLIDSGALSGTPKRLAITQDYIYVLTTLRSVIAIDRHTGETTTLQNVLTSRLRMPDFLKMGNRVIVNDYYGNRLVFIDGLNTTSVTLSDTLHPTCFAALDDSRFVVGTDEGVLLVFDSDGSLLREVPIISGVGIVSVASDGSFTYLLMPSLDVGGTTGYLMILDSHLKPVRGVPVGTTPSVIFLLPMG